MNNKVNVRDVVIGKGLAKICVPVIGKSKSEILEQAKNITKMDVDILEWRADYYESVDDTAIITMISEIRKVVGNIPIIFTFRTKNEGGMKSISDDRYVRILEMIATTNQADLIDVEVISKSDIAAKIIKLIQHKGAKVIASYHDFYKTPPKKEILSILNKMDELDADICKVAVTPQRPADVEILMKATKEFYETGKRPVVTMSMTEMGALSRISSNTTGSAITFAAGSGASAPGQLSIKEIRDIYDAIWTIDFEYNIMLVGFMGAGKTTISSVLKCIIGLEEVDIDQYIVKKEGKSIANIFETNGEEYFRDRETEALEEIQQEHGKIVSCGGGVVLRDENIRLMKDNGVIILLTATPETTFERVRHSTSRPILNGNMTIEHITELMNRRKDRYLEVADIIVATDGKNVIEICEEILARLLEYGKNS